MATASPTQLYERVSEVEALSRNDHLNGEVLYQVSQEEALSRKTRGEHCERQCWYSHFAERTVCETFCTSRHQLSSKQTQVYRLESENERLENSEERSNRDLRVQKTSSSMEERYNLLIKSEFYVSSNSLLIFNYSKLLRE